MTFREFFDKQGHWARATGKFKNGKEYNITHVLPLDSTGKKTIFEEVYYEWEATTQTYMEESLIKYINQRYGQDFDAAFTFVDYQRQFLKLCDQIELEELLERSIQYN